MVKVLVCAMQKLGSTLTKIWYNIHFQLTKIHQISCNHLKTACNSQNINTKKMDGWCQMEEICWYLVSNMMLIFSDLFICIKTTLSDLNKPLYDKHILMAEILIEAQCIKKPC